MIGRICLAATLIVGLGVALIAEPVRFARHPDYHAGQIAFSYYGDIWLAAEDGSTSRRLTDNRGHEAYPRFSPDGQWVAFSSNRHGNYDVFVVPVAGGASTRLTFHTGNDEVVDWSRDSQRVVFRATHADGAFPTVSTLYEVPATGGQPVALPVDWGFAGSFSPDGDQLIFNRHPATWTRRHYRGSYAADLWIANLAQGSYRELMADEQYNRYWPMWGNDDAIYFVGDPLPDDSSVKPGSPQVYRSVNNIYRIAADGSGQPTQVTRHTSGSLFWPSMSADGRVIVYEEDFGIWKLDVASGRTTELTIVVAAEPKDNNLGIDEVENVVDGFDLSPSGQRAVISAQGQVLTIATGSGDIRRVAPDAMASRNRSPSWSDDGQHIAFLSDRSGNDELWLVNPDGSNLRPITNLEREISNIVWTPDSSALLYTATDRSLYRYTVADGQTTVVTTGDVGVVGAVAVSPDSQWVSFSKQDLTSRSHIYVVPITGGTPRHITTDRLHYSESNGVWTGDGRYMVFTSTESVSGGIASQSGVGATTTLWALPLTEEASDLSNEDVDSEAQAAAAGGGQGGGTGDQPSTVTIEWDGLADRARQLVVPGTGMGSLTPAPTGTSIALRVTGAGGGRGGRGRGGPATAGGAGLYMLNVATEQLTRLAEPEGGGGGGRGGRGGRGGGGSGSGLVFTGDGRTLYFRQGTSLYATAVGGGRGGRAGGRGAQAAGGTARQVTYTAYLEVDQAALRSQIFQEGWRVMRDRFYDENMHGVDWAESRGVYAPLLDHIVDPEDLRTVMMLMIGQLNASHTGVRGGPSNPQAEPLQTRYPGFDIEMDDSGFYRVGHVYDTGPADRNHLNIEAGHYVVSINGEDVRPPDNYWRYLTITSGTKFHFMINDQPSADGAWAVAIEPINNGPMGNLRYARWVEQLRQSVEDITSGEIGYLHIRAMNAPSLRQFQLDLAANATKQALIIDQRFNGGGGIDQELLAILSGREYQVTQRRNSSLQVSRPRNFYGPMVVMQNERSASDAEMFPAGFRDLGLGKVIGVPTMGAVIGTGSYTLLDGFTIRTPGSGVWTSTGENMENYGVPPDVYIDNTPTDFFGGRDMQIEKAIEVLRAELAAASGRE